MRPGPVRSSPSCRRNARREIETQVRRVEKIETAVEPRFQEHFVAAMAIPHKTAEHPNLSLVVELPTPAPFDPEAANGRSGRRRARPSGDGHPGRAHERADRSRATEEIR